MKNQDRNSLLRLWNKHKSGTGKVEKELNKLAKNEIRHTRDLDHPNVIKLFDYSAQQTYVSESGRETEVFYLALEYVNGGELFDFVCQTGRFSEEIARYYFTQLLDALEYIHENGLSHLDIKLQNILMDSEFNLKLADFGFSSHQSKNETFKGSGEYMAPEILLGNPYFGQAVDLFAAGVLLFTLVLANPPFIKATSKDAYYKTIAANRYDMFWKIQQKALGTEAAVSESFKDLINFMLAFDPIERPSLAEIRQHEWMKGPVATKDQVLEEFKKRKEIIDEEALANTASKPDIDPNEDFSTSHTVHRGIDDGEGDDEEKILNTMGEFIPDWAKFTSFFSTSDPEELLIVLLTFWSNLTNDYSVNKGAYQVTAKHLDEDLTVWFSGSILKVPGQEKYCVEVLHESGNRFLFNKIFKKLKGYFGGHVNVAY